MTIIRISPIFLLGMLLTYSSCLRVGQNGPRSHRSINAGWLFHKGDLEHGFGNDLDDRGWARVNLPHTWNVEDPFDRRGIDDVYDIALGYYRGPSWNRKTISVPKSSTGKRLSLVFEGANKVTDVWVNGVHVGYHIGGYSGFRFDITPYVEIDQHNLIAVKVNNAYDYDIPPRSAEYTMYGGIYHDVYLLETARTYIQWAHILTPEVS